MPRKRGRFWYTDVRVLNPYSGEIERVRRSLGPEVTSRRAAEVAEHGVLVEVAEEWRATYEAERAGRDPSRDAQTVADFADEWMEIHGPTLKASSRRRYRDSLDRYVLPEIGSLRLRETTGQHIERCRADLRRRLAATTVNTCLAITAAMFSAAVRWGALERSPCDGVDRLRVPQREPAFYSAPELARWLDVCRDFRPDLEPVFLTGFRAGLRLGELRALRRCDVDLRGRRLHVRQSVAVGHVVPTSPKSGRARTVPMAADLARVLAEHIERHTIVGAAYLFAPTSAEPLKRSTLRRPFQRICERAELPVLRLHDMRHTCASLLVSSGAPLTVVQSILGHSSITTTMIYAHLRPSETGDWVDRAAAISGHTSSDLDE